MSTVTATSASTLLAGSTTAAGAQADPAEASERFLKLLVAQMQNQDPLSPMDNAQVTSQMAQISTVTGIETLNKTVGDLAGQFGQLKALQGTQLVGRNVLLTGNALVRAADSGTASAGFELAGPADRVSVEVLNASGKVIDTLDLGAQSAGRHGFEWTPSEAVATALGSGSTSFRIVAKSGAASVGATALNSDQVRAVASEGETLMLELASGQRVPYSAVKALS